MSIAPTDYPYLDALLFDTEPPGKVKITWRFDEQQAEPEHHFFSMDKARDDYKKLRTKLETENADLKNQIRIFEYNEGEHLKIVQEADEEIAELKLRAVPDWGEPGVVPLPDGPYLFRFTKEDKPFLLHKKDYCFYDGEELFDDWNDLSQVAGPIPEPREKE